MFSLANSYLASVVGLLVDCAQYARSTMVANEVPKAPVITLCLGGIDLKAALKTTVLAAVNPQNVFQQSFFSLKLANDDCTPLATVRKVTTEIGISNLNVVLFQMYKNAYDPTVE